MTRHATDMYGTHRLNVKVLKENTDWDNTDTKKTSGGKRSRLFVITRTVTESRKALDRPRSL